MRRLQSQRHRERAGFTLVELFISGILLAAIAATALPILAATARQQQETLRRQAAVQAAANLLERYTVKPWEELQLAESQGVELPAALLDRLPEARGRVAILPAEGEPPARRIQVELDWQDSRQQRTRPVQLTTWVYQPKEQP